MKFASPKILKIIMAGDSVLEKISVPVEKFDENLRVLIQSMTQTMYAHEGIGLAAPQIGKSLSLCVIDVQPCFDTDETCKLDGKKTSIRSISPMVIINPKITKFSKTTSVAEEGCLSVPHYRGAVERPNEIEVCYVDENAKPHRICCDGILARCMQHEIDHLLGVLFTQKVV